MTKRILALFALLATLMLSLSVTAAAQETVTVRWWHINTNENEAAFWQQVADDYMVANPNVTIEITILENEAFKSRLVTVMQAGDPPDLFQSWGGGVLWQFADANLVRDISPELEGEWKDSFSAQAALELYGNDGEYYGVPWNWGAVGFFYNKALFTQAGLDPETPPATWEELLLAIDALKAADITPIALGEQDKWPGHFWWVYLALRLGGGDAFLDAYNRDGSFADAPFVEAGEYLAQLVAAEPFQEGFMANGYGQQAGIMGDGLAAMELMGQWAPGAQAGNSQNGGIGDDLGWFPFPVIEGGAGNADDVLGGGDGFSVGVNAPDEAVAFLQYITSLEVQTAAAGLWIVPTVDGAEVALEGNEIMQTIIAARNNAPYSQLYYDQFLPPAVGGAVNDNVQALFAGAATPEEVAAAIEDVASFELSQ